MSTIKQKIAHMVLNPEYTSEDRTVFVGFVRPLLYLFLFLSLFSSFILFLVNIKTGAVIELASFILFLGALFMYSKKRMTAAALIVLYTLIAAFLASLLFGRDTYYVAAFLFPVVLLLSSVILTRKVYAVTVAVTILLFIAASFESYHLYLMPVGREDPFINIFVAIMLILVSMAVINLFTGMLYRVFRAAKESEEKFRVISEEIKVGIYAYSTNRKFVYVNKYMSTLLGYTEEELLTMNFLNFVHSDDRKIVEERGLKRLAGEEVVNGYELRAIRKDGTPLWIFLSAAKVAVTDKQLGVGALFDIQQRKNLEKQVLTEKEQLAITLRSIDEGVIVTDLEGNVTLLNRAACSLLGLKREVSLGKHINILFPSFENDGEAKDNFFQLFKEYTDTGKRIFKGYLEVSGKISRPFLSISFATLKNEQSEQKGYVIVVKDITEAKKIEENAERMEKLEALGLLAGGIAHDFNNILTGIMGNIDLLSLYVKDTDDHRISERLLDAQKASSRAVNLTRQLLTFSRGGSPVKDIISLPHLVEDTVSFTLSGSNVTYRVEYPDNLWPGNVDHSQISQVVQNLAMNSKQAMEETGGEVFIRLENFYMPAEKTVPGLMLSGGRYVKITFKDNGPGIPEEARAKIFDPYFTTKETGNGLGLATVYSIVKQHGGSIEVESDMHRGTTFTFYLPAAREEIDSETEERSVYQDTLQQVAGKKSILVMDDEEIVLSVAVEMLSTLGFDPVPVTGGEACIKKYKRRLAENNPFSAVFLDLTIPGGMGGREVAADILEVDPSARLIAMSGYSHNKVMANFKEYGFSAVLRKPFLLKEVDACLKNLDI